MNIVEQKWTVIKYFTHLFGVFSFFLNSYYLKISVHIIHTSKHKTSQIIHWSIRFYIGFIQLRVAEQVWAGAEKLNCGANALCRPVVILVYVYYIDVYVYHLWTHNTWNPEEDGLQQQKTSPGAAPVSCQQETEATVHRLTRTNWTVEGWKNVVWSDESRHLVAVELET